MIFGNDSSVSVENSDKNQGMMVGANYGSMAMNQYGLGYSDTKALCFDIVRDELSKYRAEASSEAEKRNEALFERVMQELGEKKMSDAQALAEFKNPAMQFDYLEAQKAYMKAGTPELLNLLSDIIVERVNESSRSLLQIALGESIQVAPKLIPAQMATLALAFIVEHTRRIAVNSHATFAGFLRDTIIPIFHSGVSHKDSEFQHLSFTGCSQQSVMSISLSKCFMANYAGLFMRGVQQVDIPKDENGTYSNDLYPDLFIRCLNSPEKFQINAINDKTIESKIARNSKHYEKLKKLFDSNIMPDDDVKRLVESLVPEMKQLFDYWDNGEIKSCTLSSVGIIIGAQYAHQITGQKYDLHIWI